MIHRLITDELEELLRQFPVVAIVGPRQVGKTTLAKLIGQKLQKETSYIDLENPRDEVKLTDPILYFESKLDNCIILDEIQRNKELFPVLRSMVDAKREPARYILLGSASPELIRDSSESLAGRIYFIELSPLNYLEIKDASNLKDHWLKGGFPNSLLNTTLPQSSKWRFSYLQSYIERDLPALGMALGTKESYRLLRMIAHLQSQQLNYQQISKSLGVSSPTVKKYIDLLEQAFLIRRLEPFHANVKKRLVKSPKIYIRDSGLFHTLSGIDSFDDLISNPYIGSSWEAYVIEQIISVLPSNINAYYYRTQQGAELDLLLIKGNKIVQGIEIKYSSSPKVSSGTKIAMEDLALSKLSIIVPDTDSFALNEKIDVMSLPFFLEKLKTSI